MDQCIKKRVLQRNFRLRSTLITQTHVNREKIRVVTFPSLQKGCRLTIRRCKNNNDLVIQEKMLSKILVLNYQEDHLKYC